ncbi:MAG: HI0074 family nucleotidyltransferase substrate-binding subunit [Vampirovibrionia bacterium]|jgi:nucleotidyltransferase substrate binding protein (TIGR01987 family)
MSLDLSSFKNAIKQLEDSLEVCQIQSIREIDARAEKQLRAGAIQAFEFTYELSWKLIKRYLENTEPSPEFDEITFNELIRKGYEKGLLLSNLEIWKAYRKRRGTTSHTYDENKAIDIYAHIPDFLIEVKYLLKELQKRGFDGN